MVMEYKAVNGVSVYFKNRKTTIYQGVVNDSCQC